MRAWLPAWLSHYRRDWLAGDVVAGVVVTLLLVPQGLAYALVAGLPPAVGLYASLPPLLLYGLIGKSHAQSVGPMALTSLLAAATLARLAEPGSGEYLALAVWLALLSGAMLIALGLARLGFLADFLSLPVLSGFTSASALLIVLSQLAPLLGLHAQGASLPVLLMGLLEGLGRIDTAALAFGGAALLWLAGARRALPPALARTAPALAVLAALLAVRQAGWEGRLPVVGPVPSGLPSLALPVLPWGRLGELMLPAFFMALINYVQSLSVAQLLAAPRRERVEPDRELLALGVCNVGAGLFGGFPVTGGLTRSLVNAAAGANSQLASWVAAAGIALVLLFAGDALASLPLAVLAAIIVAAVAPSIRFGVLRQAWRADRADAVAFALTFALVLLLGVESGIVVGVLVSLGAWQWRSSRPHMAEVGRLPGTQHYRNVARFTAETLPGVLFLRVDESLYFGNARLVRDAVLERLSERPELTTLVLIMSAVNRLDVSAVAMLEWLDDSLAARGVTLALAEVKGPVAAVLARAGLLERFAGRHYLSTHEAWERFAAAPEFHI
ncbi:SulP family inorganic anion transporter [Pseudogulbenkiania sp. MAI-1]|uniref:SulP family inorganic anion transporter n=1 Tax=Pseudogulbenkiania sp. MAI-1 TaxID=990370 RepID=UPI00045E6BAA|nr:sulfate permease [Pseudogulbenkiania sp. MAI-1]